MIATVLGPIEASALGHTLIHEHVISSSAGLATSYPEIVHRPATIREAAARLRAARAAGIGTIVDMAPFDLGRDVLALRQVSRRSSVHIVAASGVWRAPPREFLRMEPEALATLFVREITVGIDGTPIRAGILKVATDQRGVTAEHVGLLRAVAIAHLQTGVPIGTHAHAQSRAGLEQLDVLESAGVDPSRVCIGHSDDTADPTYIPDLLSRGAWVGLDHLAFTPPGTPTREARIELLASLLRDGHGGRLLIGHDFNATVHRTPAAAHEEMRRMNPDGYLYFNRRVRSRLLEVGLPDKAVDDLTVRNPAAFLSTGLTV